MMSEILKIGIFLWIIKSIKSSEKQELMCEDNYGKNTCCIDGNIVEKFSAFLDIIGQPNFFYRLRIENFEYLKSSQFSKPIEVTEFQVLNSTFEVVGRNDTKKSKVDYFYIQNCSLILQGNGFSSFKNLSVLTIINVKFDKIDPAAFAGLTKLSFIGISDIKMTKNLTNALKFLPKVDNFSCTRCEITDEIFSEILHALKFTESLSVTSNSIKFIKCDEIARLEMFKMTINLNQLFGIFPTCGVTVVDFSENKIDTLFIQSGTTTIDAFDNVISNVNCDNFVDLIVINLKKNLMTDLMCLAGISTLKELNIDSNKFTNFEINSFVKLTKLKIISALDNPIKSIQPSIFASVRMNIITRISVDRFDFGYEILTKFYPKLYELFHNKINGSCEVFNNISLALKSQNVNLYLLQPNSCLNKIQGTNDSQI